MDPDLFLSALGKNGEALAAAATGNLDRPVPTCPDWDVAGLVVHLGRVHGWVRKVVAAGGERVSMRDAPPEPEEREALIGWYRDGLAQLLPALSVDPDTPAWVFLPGVPARVSWWRRRQALETAVHLWDVQTAIGANPDPIEADLAAAGVDEYLTEFLPARLPALAVEGLTGTLHVHATDTPGEWWLDLDAEHLDTRRDHAKADTAVRGPAAGLYLWLWNRRSPDAAGLEVFGRAETVEAWKSVKI
jgi:uncharacterized protein (TIGR03083 family)